MSRKMIIFMAVLAYTGFPVSPGIVRAAALYADVSVYSVYIWRGFTLDDDPVMQTGLSTSLKGVDAGVWGSYGILTDDLLASEEFDWFISCPFTFSGINISIGNTWYTFPAADTASAEVFVNASFDTAVSPSLTVFCDYGDPAEGGGEGVYVSADAVIPLSGAEGGLPLSLALHAGYNSGLFINGSGIDVSLTLSALITAKDGATVTPSLSYSVPSGGLAAVSDGNQPAQLFCGIKSAF